MHKLLRVCKGLTDTIFWCAIYDGIKPISVSAPIAQKGKDMERKEEIYRYFEGRMLKHQPELMIAYAQEEGIPVAEMTKYLLEKGYTKEYIEDSLERLRELKIIAPWEPD